MFSSRPSPEPNQGRERLVSGLTVNTDLRLGQIPRFHLIRFFEDHSVEFGVEISTPWSDSVVSLSVAAELSDRAVAALDWLLPDRRFDDHRKGWFEKREVLP